MNTTSTHRPSPPVTLRPVDEANWRQVAALDVQPQQADYVAAPCYYLCLCHFGQLWNPLAVMAEGEVVGFLMHAVDPEEGSCWLGGILIDRRHQCRGLGQAAVGAAIDKLATEGGHRRFALSYAPSNAVARRLYARLGFVETGETEDDEVVARLSLPAGETTPPGESN